MNMIFFWMQMHATFILKCNKCRFCMQQCNAMEIYTMLMTFSPIFVILFLIWFFSFCGKQSGGEKNRGRIKERRREKTKRIKRWQGIQGGICAARNRARHNLCNAWTLFGTELSEEEEFNRNVNELPKMSIEEFRKALSKDKIKLITSKGGGGLYRDFVVELKEIPGDKSLHTTKW